MNAKIRIPLCLTVFIVSLFFLPGKTINTKVVYTEGEGTSRLEALYSGLRQALIDEKGLELHALEMIRSGHHALSGIIDEESFQAEIFSESIYREILTKSSGYIRRFEILSKDYDSEHELWSIKLAVTMLDYQEPGLSPESRYNIAALPFRTSASSYQIEDQTIPGNTLARRLVSELVDHITQAERFAVLDRQYMDEYISEKELVLSEDAGVEEKARLGRIQGADYLITGLIEEASLAFSEEYSEATRLTKKHIEGNFTVNYRVIVTASSQIRIADTITLSLSETSFDHSLNTEERLSKILFFISRSISNTITDTLYPLKIVSIQEDNTLVLNQGGKSLDKGEILRVYTMGQEIFDPYTQEPLGRAESYLGEIEVVRITPQMSYAVMREGSPVFDTENVLCRRVIDREFSFEERPDGFRTTTTIRRGPGGEIFMPFD